MFEEGEATQWLSGSALLNQEKRALSSTPAWLKSLYEELAKTPEELTRATVDLILPQ
ncbi:MAG: hypothetical protein M3Z85_13495 [Acidobacteriota bacterium]|nr:hypothetical protein [Acidobacteriota bacterium]